MKFLRLFIFGAAVVGLVACGSTSAADFSTTTSTFVTTSTAVAVPDCSQEALDGAVGERQTYVIGCSSNWAALQPRSWECGEHCFAFIYKWEQAKWNLMMKCDQYSPLSADGFCTGMTGQISDGNYTESIAEFPSKEVTCQIWAKSLYAEFEKIAGC